MTESKHTTISVTPAIRDELRAMKRGQESYSTLLERLLAEEERD